MASSRTDQGGTLVLDLRDGVELEAARQALGLDLRWAAPTAADEALAVAEVADLGLELQRLAGHPLVEVLEPSVPVESFGFPDDPFYDKQWNMRLVGVERGWRAGGGHGVVVAVLDTGLREVEDLEGLRLQAKLSMVPGEASGDDKNGHGTHVAGTIAQATHNGKGVVGVAPEATLLPIQVLSGRGFGQSEWVAAGIEEAVDQGAQIISLSLGGPPSAVIAHAVAEAVDAGVLVVAAAGNTGRQGVSSPANLPGVLAVSATDPKDGLARYSSWGNEVDLSAPGGDTSQADGGILQDTIEGSGHAYKAFQGTSMATPHVSGAAAVLMAQGAGDAQEVARLLAQGSVDLGPAGPDPKFGAGRLDLAGALGALARRRVAQALTAAGLTLLLAWWAKARGALLPALLAALLSGGLWFLWWVPLRPWSWFGVWAAPPLAWGGQLPSWGGGLGAQVWASALAPLVLTFGLGPTRLGRWVLPLVVSWGVGLAWPGAVATGSATWNMGNATACLLAALAIVFVQRVRSTRVHPGDA